jgi:hypothetical protein
MAKEKSPANVRALVAFRLKGKAVNVGDVVAKTSFAQKSDWQNLLHMEPARVEETEDKVGKATKAAAAKSKGKAAAKGGEGEGEGDGGLPGA